MTALRELFASYFVEFDKEGALAKGDKQVDSLAAHILDVGKGIVAAFAIKDVVDFTHQIIEQADALRDQTLKLRVSAGWLQGWQHAAGLAGSSAEGFTGAFTKFNKNVAEAQENAKGPGAEAFKALGISMDEVKAKSPAELMDKVAAGIAGIESPAKRTQVAMALFGKSGAELLPLFSEGPEAIAKMRAEVSELGAAFDQEFLDQSDEFNDNIARMKLGLRGLAIQAIGPLLKDMVGLAQGGVRVLKGFISWVRGTKLVEAGILALKVKGVLALLRVIPLLVAKIGGWRVALMKLGRFALKTLLPLLLLEDIIVFLSGGKSALGRNLDRIFGEGTQADVRALLKELVGFFGMFKSKPDEVRKAFDDLPRDMRKSMGSFGAFLGGWGQSIVEVALFAVSMVTGGWNSFFERLGVLAWAAIETFGILWTEVKFGAAMAAAWMADQFDKAFNFVADKIGWLQKKFGQILALVPGYEELGKEIAAGGQDKQDRAAAPGETASDQISQQWDQARLKIADDFELIRKALAPPAGAPAAPAAPGLPGAPGAPGAPGPAAPAATAPVPRQVTKVDQNVRVQSQVTQHITTAPGTVAEQAKELYGAASKGASKGFDVKQVRAALVPTVG